MTDIHDSHGSGFTHLRDILPGVLRPEGGGRGGGRESEIDRNIEGKIPEMQVQKALGKEMERKGDARGEGRKRRGYDQTEAVDRRCKALVIARQLNDEKNLAFHEFVLRRVPEDVVRDALVRALDVPLRNVRRSRGALFASILAPHLKKRRR